MTSLPPLRPLDGLQQMMLRWEEFHPLNAAHIIELGETVAPELATEALHEALRTLRLPLVEFSNNRTQVRYLDADFDGAPAIEVVVVPDDGTGDVTTRETLDDLLNRPFPDEGPHWAFRFAIIDPATGPTRLLIGYRHAVSDSRGVSLIARCWLRTLFGLSQAGDALNREAPSSDALFPEQLAPKRALWRLGLSVRELTQSLTCRRPFPTRSEPYRIVADTHGTRLSLARVKQSARTFDVTVQDLFFAALFEGLSLLGADQPRAWFRRCTALYATIDLRKESPVPLDDAFGQWLASLTVRVPTDPALPFADRARLVADQTRAAKASREYRAHAPQLATMARLWDSFPRWYNRISGPRLFPVTSLVSNVNLSDFLDREIAAGFVADYQRFTGTGILTPMMAGLTTVGAHINLTTTRHSNVFDTAQHDLLLRHTRRRLEGDLPDVISPWMFHDAEDAPSSLPPEPQRRHLPVG
jgi:hypothetical protein